MFYSLQIIFIPAVMDDLHAYVNPKNGKHQPMISDELHEIVTKHSDVRVFLQNCKLKILYCSG